MGQITHARDVDDAVSTRPALSLASADHDAAAVRDLLEHPRGPAHVVQFYESDDFLCTSVARFVGAGLAASEPIVVLATEAHRVDIVRRLEANAFDVDRAERSGQLTMLDARETLAQLLVGGRPDWKRFEKVVGGLLARCSAHRPDVRIRAYGEMVDLLWREGNQQAALQLEEMWNDLGKQHQFALLCAYVMGNFYNEADADRFRQVCATHSHVIPTERFSALDDAGARMREITMLQQRAAALESELENRKRLESELRAALASEQAARAEAERTVRFNEIFAGVLGHDLRNPLSAITTGANYIARLNAGEKETKAATRILSSADRMARMIDQLLDFTRIRVGGGLVLNRTEVDLGDLGYRVKEEIEAAHPECTVAFEAKGDLVGRWDADRLLQVFSNLVGNAVHHGSADGQVDVLLEGGDAEVLALVRNAGTVPTDLLPVLFEPFRGTTKKQRNTRGLGLGLFITQQIILAHGGTIEVVSSETSNRTTFRVRLPRTAAR